MATIKPFFCVRPAKEEAAEIAALPYDVYTTQEAKREVKLHPHSFLKIDRAETQFDEFVDIYSDKVYDRAAKTLREMIEDGEFQREEQKCYYIYEITMDGRTQTGIAGCAAIDDYLNHCIMKHENTRADKERDRIAHVDRCNAQTGPIFLVYRAKKEIDEIVERNKETQPLYDFVSDDTNRHRVWKISGRKDQEKLEELFGQMDRIYIADGHHRAASAVKVGLKRRLENPGYSKDAPFNYFLSVLFPDDQLLIMDYNRMVKDLNGKSAREFLDALSEKFEVQSMGQQMCRPAQKGEIGMYLEKQWYRIHRRERLQTSNPVEALDVSVLQNEILDPILGIKDPKTDQRISFIGGIRGLEALKEEVDSQGEGVAFAMYPTDIKELFAVADAGMLMPPKSTWFEPKLRSGLFIYEISE